MTERELESQEGRDREGRGNAQPLAHREMRHSGGGGSGSRQGGSWKRRRRGEHSKKVRETRQNRLVWLVLGGVLPILGGGFLWAAAGYFRCESDAFRKALAEQLSQKSGFKVHVGPIEMQGLNLTAPNLSLSNGSGVIRYAECRNLRATVAPKSFFGGDWEVMDLRIDQLDVHFASIETAIESASRDRRSVELKVGSAGFGLSPDPGGWLVESIQVRSLNLFWSESEGMDSWVRGCRLTAANFSEDGKVRLSGGAAAAWGYSPLQVDFAELRIGQDEAQIVRARLRESASAPGGAGIVELNGSAGWRNEEGVSMEIGIREFDLGQFVSESWKERLGGQISADLVFEGRLRAGEGGITKGTFGITDGWLQGLPVLEALAEASGESGFRHLEMEEGFGGEVTLSRGGVALDSLVFESGGLIRVGGAIGWRASGALSGELEVGIPAATLDRFRGGKPGFFGNPENGYCKARLVASGTLEAPRENLSEILLAAAADPGEVTAKSPARGLRPGAEEKEDRPRLEGNPEKARLEKLFRALLE